MNHEKLQRLVLIIVLIVALIFIIIWISSRASITSKTSPICKTSADCPGHEVCQNGVCVQSSPIVPEPEPQVSCDCEFGVPQQVIFDVDLDTFERSIQKGYDGLIYASFSTYDYNLAAYINYVGRYLKDGTLDTTFGTAGYITIETPLAPMSNIEILPLTDGSFACFNRFGPPRLWRMLSDGTIDPGFPIITIALITGNTAIDSFDPERRLVIGNNGGFYYCQSEFYPSAQHFLKYTSTGLDLSYGTFSGRATFNLNMLLAGFDGFIDMRLVKSLSNGSLVIFHTAQRSPGVYRPAVTKLTPTGAIDTSFGVNGHFWDANEVIANGPFTPWGDIGLDGSIYYIGTGCFDSICSVETSVALKLTATGQLDTTWGVDGYFVYNASPPYTGAASLAVEPCGGVMIAYWCEGATNDTHIIRLDASGNLNPLYPIIITGEAADFETTVISGGEFVGDPIYYHFEAYQSGKIFTLNCV